LHQFKGLIEGEDDYNGTPYQGLDMEWIVWDGATKGIAVKAW
jgi:hypothetical protein